jgi:O-antigen/teichoic acid export membrane protein
MVSAMLLLGNIGMLGLGTLLMGELPRQSQSRGALILTSLLAAGVAGGLFGLIFALAAPWLAADLAMLGRDGWSVALFATGVAFTSATFVWDQAVLGLLRGELQLWRNGLHSALKLALLVVGGSLAFADSGLTIYLSWALGSALSLALIYGVITRTNRITASLRPRWDLLRGLGWEALGHHALNIALLAPGLLLPLIVTSVLSAQATAYFYVAWMIASMAYVLPGSLATVLYPMGAANHEQVNDKLRLTIFGSLAIGVAVNVGLIFLAEPILHLFGDAYAAQATEGLRLLGLGIFPVIVRSHYITISRIRRQLKQSAGLMLAGGALEFGLATLGAGWSGLTGLFCGWLLAITLEAVILLPSVWRAARIPSDLRAGPTVSRSAHETFHTNEGTD